MSALSFTNSPVCSKAKTRRIFHAETLNKVFGKGISDGDF